MHPTRVLMVCLGNICRSPMAHAILDHKLAAAGLGSGFLVDSCGTGPWHVGERPDPRTLAVLDAHAVPSTHRARQLHPSDADFDWILCMDASNLANVRRALGGALDPQRARLMLEPVGGGEVPDPYTGGPEDFLAVYRMLDRAADAWISRWTARRSV